MDDASTGTKRLERHFQRSEERGNRRLRIAIFVVFLMIFLILAGGLFRYLQMRSERPRSNNEFQIQIWKTEVSRNPDNPRPHINLGYLYNKVGQTDRAYYELNTAIGLDKNNPVAWYYLGLVDLKKGDKKEAVSDLKKAVKLAATGDKYLPLFKLGEVYAKDKKYTKAISYFKKSAEDQPIMWNSHYELAVLYEKTGEDEKALSEYKVAHEFNESDRKINEAIKTLSKKLED